ncbi:MAG: glycoside hydrolase [Pedobacter sp.]|nr:MAG: glycoside hydrolase [Pedobacter sp.]
MARISAKDAGGVKVLIALDLTAWSEGTSRSKYTTDSGYDILVEGVTAPPGPFPKIFTDYSKHPNVLVTVNNKGLRSTAAGRYQFLIGTWTEVVNKYGFKGRFTPEAQDLAAIKKFTERGAMPAILAGDWPLFISKCNKEWASFTGSPYNQNPHSLQAMLAQVKVLEKQYANA